MDTRNLTPRTVAHMAALVGASVALFASCAFAVVNPAYATTAAEKRAEADEVFAQIDALQTNLNKVMEQYDSAQSSYEDAVSKRDEASAKIDEKSKQIDELETELSEFAVGMYKQGGAGTFIDVLMDSTSFEQFVTAWDACSAVSDKGSNMLESTKQARADLEEAKATYEKQGKRAEKKMAEAENAKAEIEETQAALRTEAEKLSAEADELQRQEEAAAEAARLAEEARKQREAELAAAAEAAAKAEAEASQQEDNEADDEGEDDDGSASSGSQMVVMGTGYFTNPCPTATSSSGFGYREFDNSFHKGLDMAAPEGTPYYAADNGTVMYATNDGGYNGGAGNWVVISHGNGIVTKYMHSSATYVKPGDYVEAGQNIGAVGNTGQSFGAHLHFQVEVDGVAVNPLNYI